MSPGTVYLLHFDLELGGAASPLGRARHYIGWAKSLDARLAHHRAGTGARITAHLARLGGTFRLARTWEGDRTLERALKRRKGAPAMCPICRGERSP